MRAQWAGPLEGYLRHITSQYLYYVSTGGGFEYYRRNSEKVFLFDFRPENNAVSFGAEILGRSRNWFGRTKELRLSISGVVDLGNPTKAQIKLTGDTAILEDRFGVDFDRLRTRTADWFKDKASLIRGD